MSRQLLIALLVVSFQLLAGQDNIAIIKSSRMASNEAIAKKDINGISKYWLDDFIQIRGNGDHLTGKDTLMALWKEMFRTNPDVSFVRNPKEIIIDDQDQMAWETGIWTGINTYSRGGNYSAMWRKKEGGWKLQAELFVALK